MRDTNKPIEDPNEKAKLREFFRVTVNYDVMVVREGHRELFVQTMEDLKRAGVLIGVMKALYGASTGPAGIITTIDNVLALFSDKPPEIPPMVKNKIIKELYRLDT